MKLSVVIVNYNVRYFLKQCLHSVIKASENIECEIFVVDNNSTDGSCSMVRTEFPGVILIMNKRNAGYSAANNQALKIAEGTYVLILNPDTLVEEGTLARCIKFMEDHPDAGAVGVKMIDGYGRLLPESKRALPTPGTAFYKIFGLSYIFPRSGLFNRYYLNHLDDTKTAKVDILSGAFMFMRMDAVKRTGLLDEIFFMYGEDIDYSYRLIKSGYSNYYFPGTRIIHYKGESTRKGDLNVVINFYKAMIIFVKKHFSNGNVKTPIFLIEMAVFIRAIISFGRQISGNVLSRLTVPPSLRTLFSRIFYGGRKAIIVAGPEGFDEIKDLMLHSEFRTSVEGRVSTGKDDISKETLGSLNQIKEIIETNKIKEVIFASRELSVSRIIETMCNISGPNIRIRIASYDGKYIIGSNHINNGTAVSLENAALTAEVCRD